MPEERELVEIALPLQLRRIPRWCLDFNSTESSVHRISKPLSPCLLPFWLPKSSTSHPRPIQLRRLTRHESGQSLGVGMLLAFKALVVLVEVLACICLGMMTWCNHAVASVHTLTGTWTLRLISTSHTSTSCTRNS